MFIRERSSTEWHRPMLRIWAYRHNKILTKEKVVKKRRHCAIWRGRGPTRPLLNQVGEGDYCPLTLTCVCNDRIAPPNPVDSHPCHPPILGLCHVEDDGFIDYALMMMKVREGTTINSKSNKIYIVLTFDNIYFEYSPYLWSVNIYVENEGVQNEIKPYVNISHNIIYCVSWNVWKRREGEWLKQWKERMGQLNKARKKQSPYKLCFSPLFMYS